MTSRVVIPPHEFDFPLTVRCGQAFRWSEQDAGLWRGWDGSAEFQVEIERGGLGVGGDLDHFRSIFQLNLNLAQVREQLVWADAVIEPVVESLPGLRLMQPRCTREVFFSFLCSANNHLPRITAMVQSLCQLGEGEFPSLEAIAGVPEVSLRQSGFGYRAGTIPEVARELVARGGEAYLAALKTYSYERAHEELTSIRSIGDKLADCIQLYGLHQGAAVPVDTHLAEAATRLYFPAWSGALTPLRKRQMGDAIRDRFGDLAGWAQLYLFVDQQRNWRARRPSKTRKSEK